jgi:exodeoxyribonuclease-3
VLAGDFNVVPTNFDIYNAGSWRFDAVLQPQTRERLRSGCWRKAGPMRRATCIPKERIYTFWVNEAKRSAATRASAWTSCC